jgi:pimeloyl-ACP methyl ester carboxylesterase
MRKSDRQVLSIFKKHDKVPIIDYFQYNSKSMRYIMAGDYNKHLPTVLFIHGAPGSSTDYFDFLQDSILVKQANLIAIDRLGYGYSSYGKAETSIQKQAFIINKFIDSLQTKNILLVGWSFGGPIAVKTAIQNTKVTSLLLLAPAIDPSIEKHFFAGHIAKWKATRWLVPTELKIAEQEKLTHVDELIKMKDDWSKIQVPIIHIHGDKDRLVPFENLSFSEKMISNKYLTSIVVKDAGHLLPWKNYELVVENIRFLINN